MSLQGGARKRGRMIFHTPFPVRPGATSASEIRPWKMLQAFKSLGYDVFEVTGYASERRRRFAVLQRKMSSGWRPDFVYSEAATIPSSFTEPKHFPLVLNLERKFFRFLHQRGVPIGVFYRDVYWAFPDYRARVGAAVARAMTVLYRREIETFNKYVDVVFLPSEQMAQHIPGLRVAKTVALPPGAEIDIQPASSSDGDLGLIYVGGLDPDHYDMEALLDAVASTSDVFLTVCGRADQVAVAPSWYPAIESGHVRVVSRAGAGLDQLYREAEVASLVMRPQEYRSFAAPMKLYEYFGHGKPVIVSEGTHAAQVVRQWDAGWVVPYSRGAIEQRLVQLRKNPDDVQAKSENAKLAALDNTWEARAKEVAEELVAFDAGRGEGPHVLMVPSWYPKDEDDAHGSFFREQAEAMSQAGLKMGVLALSQNALYRTFHPASPKFDVREENGLTVLRGSVNTHFPFQRSLNTRLARRRLRAAWNAYVAENGRPDVIHAHSLYPGAFYAKALSDMYGVPFVYTEHRTLNHLPARSKAAKLAERRVAAAASSRHGVSEGHATHLSERFGGLPWAYTPNLLPDFKSATRTTESERSDVQFTFGHLSILDPVKRVENLIEAFARLHEEDETVRLLIGGEGEESAALVAQVSLLGLGDSVSFLGSLTRDQVADFYSKIDAFVLPSVTEAMGVVQIEALAAGVPVISTRTWGGETVARDERDGLLVDIDDVDQLLDAMRSMRSVAEGVGEREARTQRCVERFGTEAFVERYRHIYTTAAKRGNSEK